MTKKKSNLPSVVSKYQAREWWEVTGRSTAKCDWCDRDLERFESSFIVESQTTISVSGEPMEKGPDLICLSCFSKTRIKPYPESEWKRWKKDYKNMIGKLR